MKKIKSTNNPDRVRKVQSFLGSSSEDYIAARVLFLSNLPQQAAILSSTAIEKCFKAILAFNGNESHGHLQKAHWNAVKNFDRELYNSLNPEFLDLNKKVYSLRYTDDLPPSYNVVIASREFLAELDQTILSISRLFQVGNRDESYRFTKLEHLISSRDSRACSENHVLTGEPKESYIYSKPQFIYELRNVASGALLEMMYWSESRPENSSFLRPGCAPSDDSGRTFKLSFPRVENAG
jgi:hypothetical protein